MFCTVYQLRRNGQRLSPAEVKKTEAKGNLSFGKRGGHPVTDARLSDNEGTEFLVLEHAMLQKIEKGGLLFKGLERVGYNEHVRQGWWCVPEARVSIQE
ncbi:MAG: hypothetical protein JSS14_01390 [Proteobacteria bacterium]|nr:hypothetical protein [Pseudomonadota bacterium]